MNPMDDFAVKVEHVSKDFRYSRHKAATIKSAFTGLLKRRVKDEKVTQHALRDVSFEIKRGEFFGIVGRNGSGKSTMLKMIAGIYQPNEGSVRVQGKLVPFIELGVGFNPELSGRENVYLNGAVLGFSEKEVDAFYNEVVDFAELHQYMDKKLKNYSSGMQVRLAFSMAIRAQADILLIDEVLAVGDADFQRKCYAYFRTLKKNHKTVVFVSHNMDAVRQFCDRAIMIEDGKLVQEGDADKVAASYTKMFINQDAESGTAEGSSRWGDNSARFASVKVEHINDDAKTIQLTTTIKAAETIEDVSTGFMLRNSSGLVVLGSNSVMQGRHHTTFKKDKTYTVQWQIPKILNDDTYTVDLSISYHNGVVAQWWQEATSFRVELEQSTPFIVKPPLGFELHEK